MEVLERNILTPIRQPTDNTPRIRKVSLAVRIMRVYFSIFGRLMPKVAAQAALKLFSQPRTKYNTKAFDEILSKSSKFIVESNGLDIHGRIWDNIGPTVLLVHGWETSGLHMGSFIEPLWSAGYKVVIFDGPAHGNSQGDHALLPEFTEAMWQVIKKTGPVDHVVAHSFGGFASVYLASIFAKEISFKKMVLISTPNKLTKVLKDFAQFLKLPKSVTLEMYALIKELYHTDPEEIESAMLGQTMHVDDVLVIHDKFDSVVPFYNGLEINHFIDQSNLLETENLGHNRLLKNPQVISRVEQFLGSN